MDDERQTPVLIAGAGLGGLSAALFLSWHGVPCLVVERHPGTSRHPRARGINPRAMELMRQVGLEEAIRSTESARALAGNRGVFAAESLAGRQFGELREDYFLDSRPDLTDLSPSSWCLCHQDEYEPILLDRARELGASVLFGTELVSFTDDGAGVDAVLRDRASGAERTVRSRYLIAADGPQSPIRQRLGIGFPGLPPLGHFLNVHFRADLRAELGNRRFIMCYTMNRALKGALMPLDNAEKWLLHVVVDPAVEDPATITDERCRELVRASAGVPDLDVEIIGSLPWSSPACTAESLRSGNVFLVGDAAHVMPPSGAFGSSTGIQDAHNLAWKLALTLRGQSGPELLESYDSERRRAAAATVEQAVLRSRDRPRMMSEDSSPPHPDLVPDDVVWFGFRYSGDWERRFPGRPGTRAPHLPLTRDGEALSTLDLFGPGFTLLCGPDADDWQDASGPVAAEAGIPLAVYRIGTDVVDVKENWPAVYGVPDSGCVLVRPDGVVAWRFDGASPIARTRLGDALCHALGRVPASALR